MGFFLIPDTIYTYITEVKLFLQTIDIVMIGLRRFICQLLYLFTHFIGLTDKKIGVTLI